MIANEKMNKHTCTNNFLLGWSTFQRYQQCIVCISISSSPNYTWGWFGHRNHGKFIFIPLTNEIGGGGGLESAEARSGGWSVGEIIFHKLEEFPHSFQAILMKLGTHDPYDV